MTQSCVPFFSVHAQAVGVRRNSWSEGASPPTARGRSVDVPLRVPAIFEANLPLTGHFGEMYRLYHR